VAGQTPTTSGPGVAFLVSAGIVYEIIAAMIDPNRAKAIIAGGLLAGVVMYGCYGHAKSTGLKSSEPATESW